MHWSIIFHFSAIKWLWLIKRLVHWRCSQLGHHTVDKEAIAWKVESDLIVALLFCYEETHKFNSPVDFFFKKARIKRIDHF